jgi:hypothetical protein
MRLLSGLASFRPTECFSFRFAPRQRFACPLRNEVSFYLSRQGKSEGEHFGLDVIAQSVSVFNGPHPASALEAETENLHYHKEASSEPAEFAADNQVPFVYMPQEASQSAFAVGACAGNGLFNPTVDTEPYACAELTDLKPLILYRLLVRADADVSVIHKFRDKKSPHCCGPGII